MGANLIDSQLHSWFVWMEKQNSCTQQWERYRVTVSAPTMKLALRFARQKIRYAGRGIDGWRVVKAARAPRKVIA